MVRSLKYIGLLFATLSASIAGHELVLVGVANLVGVSVVGIGWLNIWTLSPAVFLDVTGPPSSFTVIHYGGGIVIGLLWLIGYLVWHR